jgi:hypothetical protein
MAKLHGESGKVVACWLSKCGSRPEHRKLWRYCTSDVLFYGRPTRASLSRCIIWYGRLLEAALALTQWCRREVTSTHNASAVAHGLPASVV